MVQEFVDAFLAGRGLLHDTGDPTDGRHRPGQHVDVDDELGDVTRRDIAGHDLQSADVDGDDRCRAHHEDHEGEEPGIDLRQVHGHILVAVALPGEVVHLLLLADVALHDADTAEHLLGHARQLTQLLLDESTPGVDDVGDVVDAHRQDGQGDERVQGQRRRNGQHGNDDEEDRRDEVRQVHHGRAQVHPDLVDVLRDAAHQVTGVVALVEVQAQLLVVVVDHLPQVVLDEAAHDDDRLPRQVQEEAHHQGQQQNKAAEQHQRMAQNAEVLIARALETLVHPVIPHLLDDEVQCFADHLRLQHLKVVTQADEDEAEGEAAAVLPEELVQKFEFAHAGLLGGEGGDGNARGGA